MSDEKHSLAAVVEEGERLNQSLLDSLITEHNELLVQVCELQKRTDADKFMLTYNSETGFFDRAGGTYDADTVRLVIRGYKGMLAGEKPRFACNPNPYDGVWK